MADPYLPEEPNKRAYRLNILVPLYRALITGDRRTARRILAGNGHLVRCSITENMETPLHVAVASHSRNGTMLVRDLVRMMNPLELGLHNRDGNTAFCLAAIAGNVEMAEIMIQRNPELPTIPGRDYKMPLYLAAFHGKHDMVTYLYDLNQMTGHINWTCDRRDEILLRCIKAGIFDVALRIVNDHAELPQDNNLGDVLQILARKPNAFHVRTIFPNIKQIVASCGLWSFFVFLILSLRGVLAFMGNLVTGHALRERNATRLLKLLMRRLMEKPKNTIDDILNGPMTQMGTYPSHVLFTAARMNNLHFLVELIHEHPEVICMKNDDGQTIFHISVSHRYHDIYNLIYEIGSMKELIATMTDQQGNNILHLVGMKHEKNPYYEDLLAAPYKLQSEFFWYKEVRAIVPPSCRKVKNAAGKTPWEIFNENHNDLISQGEKWIKETTNRSMVVATLVASIAFSVAISIPGGYDKDHGFPLLIKNNNFFRFITSDALSFFLSSISIIIFLSISISHHTVKDFIWFLPIQLYVGHVTLLGSILALIGAFVKNLSTMYKQKSKLFDIFANLAYYFTVLILVGFLALIISTYAVNIPLLPRKRKLYRKTHGPK